MNLFAHGTPTWKENLLDLFKARVQNFSESSEVKARVLATLLHHLDGYWDGNQRPFRGLISDLEERWKAEQEKRKEVAEHSTPPKNEGTTKISKPRNNLYFLDRNNETQTSLKVG